jgi:hypothetical protein
MKNVTVFFELPVLDFDRAVRFYQQTLGWQVQEMAEAETQDPDMTRWGLFGAADGTPLAGALFQSKTVTPAGKQGPYLYLDAQTSERLSQILAAVEAAGGEVMMANTFCGDEVGYMGMFLDTEGNRLALHALTQSRNESTAGPAPAELQD